MVLYLSPANQGITVSHEILRAKTLLCSKLQVWYLIDETLQQLFGLQFEAALEFVVSELRVGLSQKIEQLDDFSQLASLMVIVGCAKYSTTTHLSVIEPEYVSSDEVAQILSLVKQPDIRYPLSLDQRNSLFLSGALTTYAGSFARREANMLLGLSWEET